MSYDDDFMKFRNDCAEWARKKNENFLEEWCREAHVNEPIGYYNQYNKLTIYTNHPGHLIGRRGELIEKYKRKFADEFSMKNVSIDLVEVCGGFANYKIHDVFVLSIKSRLNERTEVLRAYKTFGDAYDNAVAASEQRLIETDEGYNFVTYVMEKFPTIEITITRLSLH